MFPNHHSAGTFTDYYDINTGYPVVHHSPPSPEGYYGYAIQEAAGYEGHVGAYQVPGGDPVYYEGAEYQGGSNPAWKQPIAGAGQSYIMHPGQSAPVEVGQRYSSGQIPVNR
jgi:hypothetical protein